MRVYQSDQVVRFQALSVFLYGTLMVAPLLALILTRNWKNKNVFFPLWKKAIL